MLNGIRLLIARADYFFMLMKTPGDSSESEEKEGSSGSRQDDTLHSG